MSSCPKCKNDALLPSVKRVNEIIADEQKFRNCGTIKNDTTDSAHRPEHNHAAREP